MAKNKKKTQPRKTKKETIKLSLLQQNLILISVILVYLLILLKPLTIDGLSPQGVDVIASKGQTHQIVEHKIKTGEESLWNPYIFSGMPIYQLLTAKAPSFDNLINWFSRFLSTPFMYYLVAAIGLYLLLLYLKMPPLICFFATITFVLMPHYASLYLEGHFAKFRAVMFVPWIMLCFLYFLSKRNLLSAATLALVFGLQIRTQHYQIVFYTALVMFALGIYPYMKDLLDKEYKKFSKSTLLLGAALILGIAMAAQPLFLANEYLPYSKRGKTTINLAEQKPGSAIPEDQSAGVKIDYAMQWSTHPGELLTWVVPRFYGGMSGEKYTGNAVPALRNRVIPGYWGHMPFTQSYEYMGVLTLLLAVIGIFIYHKDKMIITLSALGIFFILLSFGRHFSIFYELFFDYFPYFNKFRAPMMSVTITGLILSICAAYGLRGLVQLKENPIPDHIKKIFWFLGGFVGLGVLLWIFGTGSTYQKLGENYDPQVMEMLKKIRAEFFQQDVIRYIFLVILGGGAIFAFLKQKMSFILMSLLMILISVVDLTSIRGRYNKDFVDMERLEKQYFRPTETDNFILEDTEIFRIMPPPQQLNNNRWAYYHQIIGGYTPIKMYAMEEILENNLTHSYDPAFPLNWNILKMLNVKYLVLNQSVEHSSLKLVHSDPATGLNTYLLKERLARAFFVNNIKIIPDEYERLRFLNQREFDPAQTAILEKNPEKEIGTADSISCRLTEFTPNYVRHEVYTDAPGLLVLSESYYPPGWRIFVDNSEVQNIYKTNHALQSLFVSAGQHIVEMRFEPPSYYSYIRMASVSAGIIYLIILGSLILNYRERIFTFFKK